MYTRFDIKSIYFISKVTNANIIPTYGYILKIYIYRSCLVFAQRNPNIMYILMCKNTILHFATLYYYLENIKFDLSRNVSIQEVFFAPRGSIHIFHNLHSANILSSVAAKHNMDHLDHISTTVSCYLKRIAQVTRSGTFCSLLSIPQSCIVERLNSEVALF